MPKENLPNDQALSPGEINPPLLSFSHINSREEIKYIIKFIQLVYSTLHILHQNQYIHHTLKGR